MIFFNHLISWDLGSSLLTADKYPKFCFQDKLKFTQDEIEKEHLLCCVLQNHAEDSRPTNRLKASSTGRISKEAGCSSESCIQVQSNNGTLSGRKTCDKKKQLEIIVK